MAPTLEGEPSNYMQTLTRYLSNIMNSTLLGLPREIKELIYFDALSHAANTILVCSTLFFLGNIAYNYIPRPFHCRQMSRR